MVGEGQILCTTGSPEPRKTKAPCDTLETKGIRVLAQIGSLGTGSENVGKTCEKQTQTSPCCDTQESAELQQKCAQLSAENERLREALEN